ncbi:hypothetical protein D3C87_2117430 [compost metagenome]
MVALQIVVVAVAADDPLVVGAETIAHADGALADGIVGNGPACIDENRIARIEHEGEEKAAAGS